MSVYNFANSVVAGAAGQSTGFYNFPIEQSLRFNSADSVVLTRTNGTATNGKKCTLSFWIKKSEIIGSTTTARFIQAYSGVGNQFHMQWGDGTTSPGDQWSVSPGEQSSQQGMRQTDATLRDPSAWYHCVWSYNSESGSESVVLYVNGVEQTSSTYTGAPTTNLVTSLTKSGTEIKIGYINSSMPDFYLAEVNCIDGQALTADSFGELKNGVWIPKDPSGLTYGTNGFHLDFADGAAIGDDESGNGNDFTATNLVASDVVPDSPTNNFCTLNYIDYEDQGGDITEGGLQIDDINSGANSYSRGTLGVTSGKWYYEVYFINAANGGHIGWAPAEFSFASANPFGSSIGYVPSCIHLSHTTTSIRRTDDVAPYSNSLVPGTYSQGAGVVLGVAYDADAGEIKYFLDGVAMDSGNVIVSVGEPDLGWMPFVGVIGGGSTQDYSINFGQDSTFQGQETAGGNSDANGIGDFAYAPPSGYLALCTSNLPEPTISTADDAEPRDYFETFTYTGNGRGLQVGDVIKKPVDTIDISNSLLFEDGDTPYYTKTFSTTPTDSQKGTISLWLKRGNIGIDSQIFSVTDSNVAHYFRFNVANTLTFYLDQSAAGSDELILTTTRKIQDTSYWHHIHVKMDMTQASNSDKLKMWIDGVLVPDTPSQTGSAMTAIRIFKNGVSHSIGRYDYNNSQYFDGYFAEFHAVDGTAYDPTEFGAFDANGIWIPQTPSVTYGNNGFYLDFSDNSSTTTLGADSSGNGNDWTPNGSLATTDQVSDSPTDNFMTLNPGDTQETGGSLSFSEGNLRVNHDTDAHWNRVNGSFPFTNGKWYYEFQIKTVPTGTSTNWAVGFREFGHSLYYSMNDGFEDVGDYIYWVDASTAKIVADQDRDDGSTSGITAAVADDYINIAIEKTDGNIKAWFGINGTWFNSGNPATGANPAVDNDSNAKSLIPAVAFYAYPGSTNGNGIFNFGQKTFNNTIPSGFTGISENNITVDDQNLESPDWVWIKNRDNADNHYLYDTVRGVIKTLHSDPDTNPIEFDSPNALVNFNKNGFTVGSDGGVNRSAQDYVAWCWNFGGAPSVTNSGGATPTNGSIMIDGTASTTTLATADIYPDKASVNSVSKGGVMTYTSNSSTVTGDTIANPFGFTPDVMFIKKLTGSAQDWGVYHKSIGNTGGVLLNESGGTISSVEWWNNTSPTSSLITIGRYGYVNNADIQHVCYAFSEVEGFSKFGSYYGNSSADGPFIFTGFRPALIIIKALDVADTWVMFDSGRDPFNVDIPASLYPSLANGDDRASSREIEWFSNGFKVAGTDTSVNGTTSQRLVYFAWAEQPFKYANAR